MPSLTDYFDKDPYKPKYQIGDRVFGHYNGVPFVGTVGNDTNKIGGFEPRVSILPDLPIMLDGKVYNVIIVKHKDIKSRLKSMDDEEPLKLPVAGSIPVKRTKTKGK